MMTNSMAGKIGGVGRRVQGDRKGRLGFPLLSRAHTLLSMADEHRPSVPIVLEDLIAGLDELERLFGDAARSVVPAVQARLREAMAARDRGDPAAAMQAIPPGMGRLGRGHGGVG